MSGQKVELTCNNCNKDFEILTKNYEKYVHDNDPIYCDDCFNKFMEQQEVVDAPKRKQFEYMTIPWENFITSNQENLTFSLYGQKGWELVQIVNNKAYFKREYMEGVD